jgi:hypothetical protein
MLEDFCMITLYMALIIGAVFGAGLVLDWIIFHWCQRGKL